MGGVAKKATNGSRRKRVKNEKWRDGVKQGGRQRLLERREREGQEKESKLSRMSARQIVFLGVAAPPHGIARSDHSPRCCRPRKNTDELFSSNPLRTVAVERIDEKSLESF